MGSDSQGAVESKTKKKGKRQEKRLGAHIAPFLGDQEFSETKRGGKTFH